MFIDANVVQTTLAPRQSKFLYRAPFFFPFNNDTVTTGRYSGWLINLMNTKTLAIIIPTLQSIKIMDLLDSIAKQTTLDRVTEIFVIGQQSFPFQPELSQFKYIYEENPTPARNRNIGGYKATADYVLFTDSDCIPNTDWIEQLLIKIDSGAEVLAGAVATPQDISYWGKCDHLFGFEYQAVEVANKTWIPYAATLNFCIQRKLFLELGGFNESFQRAGGEDREFSWRLINAGFKIFFTIRARVVHNHSRQDFKSAWKHNYCYGEMTYKFRLGHAGQRGYIWKTGVFLAKIPLMGELIAVARVILRAIIRPVRLTGFLSQVIYLPGVTMLDLAHSMGIIHQIRSNES